MDIDLAFSLLKFFQSNYFRLVKLCAESHTKKTQIFSPSLLSLLHSIISSLLSLSLDGRKCEKTLSRKNNREEEAKGSGRDVKGREGEDLLISLMHA